jgi:uncharacterized protein (UPF0335 family)
MTISNSDGQLKALVERIEHVNQEIKDLAEGRKEIYVDAKTNGFDVPALRAIIAKRAKDQAKLKSLEEMMDVYETSLGAQ